MIKTETKEINGAKYSCTQLNATKALKVQFKVMKFIGEPLIKIFAASQGLANEQDGLVSAFKNVDDPEFHALFIELVCTCMRNGQRVDFENDYGGNLLESYQALYFVLETNYKDFFLGLPLLAGPDMMGRLGLQ